MPVSSTTPGRSSARDQAPERVAFRLVDSVSTQSKGIFEAQWLAYALPDRRFADFLTEACARRLGADVVRYSFTAVDLRHLLLAGLPARRQLPWRRVTRWLTPPTMHSTGFLASSQFSQTRRPAGVQLPHFVFVRLTPQALPWTPSLACHVVNIGATKALGCSRYQRSSTAARCAWLAPGRTKKSSDAIRRIVTRGVPSASCNLAVRARNAASRAA